MRDFSEARKALDIGSVSHELPKIFETTPEAMRYALELGLECLTLPRDEEAQSGPFQKVAAANGELWDSNWVDEQLQQLDKVRGLVTLRKGNFGKSLSYWGIPAYAHVPGREINVGDINLLFKDRLSQVHPEFVKVLKEPGLVTALKEHGLSRPRLQVGVNTIDLVTFALRRGIRKHLDVFIEATRRELQAIWELTGGNMFILVEAPVLNILANATRNDPKLMEWYLKAFRKLIAAFPKGCPWGFHFCNGRLGGNALGNHGVLKTLGAAEYIYHSEETVKMSNFMLEGLEKAGFVPDVVHYPHALGSLAPFTDEKHFAPFRYLYLNGKTEYYGGAVSHLLDLKQHKDVYQMQDDILNMRDRPQKRAGVAPTCGWGSSPLWVMFREMRIESRLAYM